MLLSYKPPLHEGISPPNVNGRPSWMSTHYTGAPSFATQTKPTSAPPPRPASVLPSQAPSPAPNGQLMDASHRNPSSAPPNLPPSERTAQTVPMSSASSIPPPAHWQNTDESMRQWLGARTEEDRRKQEEERTRQESLKLDQRKVEQTMLRDSLQAGVPPYMVPFIFASLGGGNLQWAQQYITHMSQLQSPSQTIPQHQPQPQQPLSREIPTDNRSIPRNPYASQPFATGQKKQQSPSQTPNVGARSAPLSHITNGEGQIHHNPGNTGTAATAAQTQTQRMASSPKKDAQDQNQQASSIHFYHWVPPNQSQPNTFREDTQYLSQHHHPPLPSPVGIPELPEKKKGTRRPPTGPSPSFTTV